MWLGRVQVHGVRCLQRVEAHLDAGVNVFSGVNGSGKTSLLEAVYLLGHGRSFRTRYARELVASGQSSLTAYGELFDAGARVRRLGVELHVAAGPTIRVDGGAVRSSSTLARVLPMLVVNAEAQRLLSDGAAERRAVLDWLLFHVEPRYHDALRRFRRALSQRNAALRGSAGKLLSSWSHEVAELGTSLQEMRSAHLPALLDALREHVSELLGKNIEIDYFKGWSGRAPLLEVLVEATSEDLRQQRTRLGPHRADLRLRHLGRPVHRTLSRGEGKLLVYALALAQVSIVSNQRGVRPLLLLDDLPAELDVRNRSRFLAALAATGVQALITSVEAADTTASMPSGHGATVFHVEQGGVVQMV